MGGRRAGASGHPLGVLPLGLAVGLLLAAGLVATPAETQETEADVFVARAIIAYEEGRFADVLEAVDEALRLAPDHVEALYYRGLAFVALGRLDDARQALERARARAPDDPVVNFQLGVVHFGLQQYAEAEPMLEAAFRADPTRDGLGYYVGFIRYRKGDHRGALAAFERGATADPRIQQLTRFYTGLALASLGERERAAGEMEAAVRLLPSSPLVQPAQQLREALLARAPTKRPYAIEARVGAFFDDNVPVNPLASDDPFVRSLQSRKTDSFGELGSLRLDYTFFRTPAFEAMATASVFANYNNSIPDFNIVDLLGGLSLTYRGTLGSLPFQAWLLYSYDYLTLGGDPFLQRHVVTPYATLVENRNNLTAFQLQGQWKNFEEDPLLPPDESRDGVNLMGGATHYLRFEGDKHYIKLGYQFDVDDTDGRNFRYRGHRLLAGGQYTLPWHGIALRYDYDVHFRRYRHVNSIFPVTAPGTVRRSDTEQTHRLGIVVPLPWDLTLLAEFQASVARSNLDVFTFDRNVVSLSLIWTY